MNTKDRGDLALSQAINHYITEGFEVCLPIGDRRAYDMIIERGGIVSRVQVKYAGLYTKSGKCKAGLRITGGNQSFHYAKKYEDTAFDTLFIYTQRGDKYSIPWKEVKARNELTVENSKYSIFKV